jgi:hypothetical protein
MTVSTMVAIRPENVESHRWDLDLFEKSAGVGYVCTRCGLRGRGRAIPSEAEFDLSCEESELLPLLGRR